MERTLGEILSDPKISKIAPDAIRKWDLSKEEMWNKTLSQLRAEHFGGELREGFGRLFAAAETGEWYYPLYSEAECAEDETRRNVNMVWLPSEDPKADERPFILLAPGGGFVNVWNLTEGWPVAAQFNSEGYHVYILTYRVDGEEKLLEKEPRPAPKFVMDPTVTDFYAFTRDSFTLEGYDPHPFDDKIPVAI